MCDNHAANALIEDLEEGSLLEGDQTLHVAGARGHIDGAVASVVWSSLCRLWPMVLRPCSP
jgi:hypothetical protein